MDEEHIKIKAYTLESAISEKIEAMVTLDMVNSRKKDFYDIWFLSSSQHFYMNILIAAIKATFNRRMTPIPTVVPIAFTSDFADAKQQIWRSFLKKNDIPVSYLTIHNVVEQIYAFIWPVIKKIHSEEPAKMTWIPSKGWE